jgi:hypothetical protein
LFKKEKQKICRHPQNSCQQQWTIVEQQPGWVAALVLFLDEIKVSKDSEGDKRHRHEEQRCSELWAREHDQCEAAAALRGASIRPRIYDGENSPA